MPPGDHDRLAAELTATPPENAFFYASGRSSNEAAFLLQMLARAYGTTHIHNCSSYCHQASGEARLSQPVVSGVQTFDFELEVVDVDQDPDLRVRFNELVPVVMADGVELCHHFLDEDRLRRYLESR